MVVKIERPRYIKVDFLGQPPIVSKFVFALRGAIKTLGGELNLASSGVHVLEYNDSNTVIKCVHDRRDLVESAIQLLEFENLVIVVRKVSGTLKSLSGTAEDLVENGGL